MEHYAYSWEQACEERSLVLAYLFQRVPEVQMRKAWMFAQLQAFVGNALGGKSKGGKQPTPGTTFRTEDFLPAYARPAGLLPEALLEPQHCAALVQALEAGQLKGASWVLQIVTAADDLDRIRAVAAAYLELPEDGDDDVGIPD